MQTGGELLNVAGSSTVYGSIEDEMSLSSPQPEKSVELEATADESAAFIERNNSSRVPSGSEVVNKTARLVYFIFLLHGIGTLMPWNMFLTIAPSYFMNYKFHPQEANATVPDYSRFFFSYLGVCSQIPNLLLNFLNLFIVIKADLARRIIYCLIIVTAICVFTIIFIFVDTFEWMFGFFVLTMISVVILSSANGIYQNCIYGLTALFPDKFTNAVIIGNNLCGIFVTLVLIVTLIFFQDVQFIATLYFGVALITILGCLFSFLWLPKIAFYSYYVNQSKLQSSDSTEEKENLTFNGFMAILRQTWQQMLSVFLTFFVTLALFPAIVSNIGLYPNDRPYDFFIGQRFYVPVATFLNFNIFATLGNVLAGYYQWPNMKNLIYPVTLRLLFIPFFLFCNYGTTRNFRVFFKSEYAFIFMLALMSLTHGYFSSISMMYAPAAAEKSKAKFAGMMSAFFLVLGIAVGVSFTFAESYLFLG